MTRASAMLWGVASLLLATSPAFTAGKSARLLGRSLPAGWRLMEGLERKEVLGLAVGPVRGDRRPVLSVLERPALARVEATASADLLAALRAELASSGAEPKLTVVDSKERGVTGGAEIVAAISEGERKLLAGFFLVPRTGLLLCLLSSPDDYEAELATITPFLASLAEEPAAD